MIVAFTGPSHLNREQELSVVARMESLAYEHSDGLDTWRSGCAYGVDTIAARQAILSGILGVELFVPAAPHNDKLVEELADRARIVRLPSGQADPYRRRNEAMILSASLLVAFLKRPTFYRSGEWMTVNIAHKFGVQVEINLI